MKQPHTRPVREILERQVQSWISQEGATRLRSTTEPRPLIAVSRALGACGEEIARRVGAQLDFPLMDRELLEAIADDLHVQTRLVESFDEQMRSHIQSWIEGVLKGRVIQSSDYLRALTRVIATLMSYGGAVLVGRGAGYILESRAFRMRIVASERSRVESLATRTNITVEVAMERVWENDSRQQEYIKKAFGCAIDDPLNYDLMINTDCYSVDDAVELALLGYQRKERALGSPQERTVELAVQ